MRFQYLVVDLYYILILVQYLVCIIIIDLEIHKNQYMQVLQHQLNQFQFSTINSLSGQVQPYPSKTKKILKNKKQSVTKCQLKNYLFSKLRKPRKSLKSFETRLSSFTQKFKNFQLEKDYFYCPICIQLLIQPVLTECGHSFCQKCLQNLIQYNPRCPVCRLQIQICEINVDKNIKNLIQKLDCQSYADSLFEYERVHQNFEWLQRKRGELQNLQQGQYIDIKCSLTKKWTQGCIADIRINKQNKQTQFCVSYTSNDDSTKEWLSINSSRLASHSFFTGKKSSKHSFKALSFFDDLQSLSGVHMDVHFSPEQTIQGMEIYRENIIDQKKENYQTGYQNKEFDNSLNQILNEESTNFWGQVDSL